MHWKEVGDPRFPLLTSTLPVYFTNYTRHRSFAWMEILKAVTIVFKLFEVERANQSDTVIREGFFNKATECEVVINRRSF